ncbi:MAG TPA: hypothetical protein VLI93_05275 [Acetobacteraceae bacterium]|nr:hypothetical protein [Acetobacteraceae bacterium]
MSRNTILLVWLGGIVLAVLLYFAGPGHFINAALIALSQAEWAIADAIAYASVQAFDLVRAAAVALFVVFLVLGALASRRGVGRGGGMVGISVLFVVLVTIGGYESRFCWFAALLVAGAGAVNMTQRLLGPPLRASWRPGYRRGGEPRQRV